MKKTDSIETLDVIASLASRARSDITRFRRLLCEVDGLKDNVHLLKRLADKRLGDITEVLRDVPHHYGDGCGYLNCEDIKREEFEEAKKRSEVDNKTVRMNGYGNISAKEHDAMMAKALYGNREYGPVS